MSDTLPPAPGNEDTAANTAERSTTPPQDGFGQLWEKTYRMTLDRDISQEDVMNTWKANLHELWPGHSTFYEPHRGIRPGEVAGLDVSLGPARLSTGVQVTESSPTAFTLQSPEGHMFAGRNRFTVEREAGKPVAQVQALFRANDPLYELGLLFGGHKVEDRFWIEMLRNLASLYGERPKDILVRRRKLASDRKWRNAGNVRKNAAILTSARRIGRLAAAPLQMLKGRSG